ncbi:MAG TPA: hypothetical protein VLK25_05980 [Allosphingosinicella sp.]|nr:hypothetical protein [Allosphingosinicella sp.]
MATVERAPKIDSGRVINRGFRSLGDNVLPFLMVALLFVGLPSAAIQYLLLGMRELDPGFFWAAMLAGWMLAALLQGMLVRATVLDLADQDMEIEKCAMTALALILPIFAISLIVALVTVVGLLFAIVPGTLFYIAMSVAIPALIEERAGVFGSLRRSWRLTRGTWLQIFVLMVLYLIFWGVVSTIFGVAFGVRNFGMGANEPLMAALSNGLSATITAAVGAVMLASLYVELRSVKEGATTDDLASIFA